MRLDLVLLSETARSNVIEVLKPLEVRAGDTTTVDEHVRGANNATTLEDLLSSVCGGAISTFENCLNLNLVSVAFVKRLLSSSGNHAISSLEKVLLRVFANALSSTWEGGESSVLSHVIFDSLNIEAVRVMASGVVLNDSSDFTTVLFDELRSPVADSTETLDVEGLSSDAEIKATAVDKGLGVEHFTDGVVDTKTSGLSTASDTTLRDELASAAALSVDVSLTLHIDVGVLDPGHGLLVGSHIRTKAINLSADESLLNELHGVFSGDSLDLSLRVLPWVNFDTTFSTTERNISDGELEGHEGSKRLDLLQINVGSVAGTTLDGKLVSGVLGSE